jgi:hypothetical protein
VTLQKNKALLHSFFCSVKAKWKGGFMVFPGQLYNGLKEVSQDCIECNGAECAVLVSHAYS